MRECHFPLAALDKGVTFRCMDGHASYEKDEARIKALIAGDSQLLDATVHGFVASSALSRALDEDVPEQMRQLYLHAVLEGQVPAADFYFIYMLHLPNLLYMLLLTPKWFTSTWCLQSNLLIGASLEHPSRKYSCRYREHSASASGIGRR